jgi:hypothetical protein
MNTAPVIITKSCQVDDFIAKCKDKKSVTKKSDFGFTQKLIYWHFWGSGRHHEFSYTFIKKIHKELYYLKKIKKEKETQDAF